MTEGYQALRGAAAWLDLSSRGKIFAGGRDRVRFLHNLATNHVKELTPGQGCYAFFLNAQGRIQADAVLLAMQDLILLDTEPETRERILAHMRRYIIADQVELDDATGRLATLAVEGPGAAAALSGLGAVPPPAAFAHAAWDTAILLNASSTGAPGFRIFVPAAEKADLVARLESAGVAAARAEDARVVRLEHGVPRYGEDISDTTLPQETRQMHALSFNKGCYLGQEIVERIRSRGHVNKTLVKLTVESAQPLPPGEKLRAESAEAGEVTSSAYSPASGKVVALAYVRTPHAQPGTLLDAGPVRAVVAAWSEPDAARHQ